MTVLAVHICRRKVFHKSRHSEVHNLGNHFSPSGFFVSFVHGDCVKQGTDVSRVTTAPLRKGVFELCL